MSDFKQLTTRTAKTELCSHDHTSDSDNASGSPTSQSTFWRYRTSSFCNTTQECNIYHTTDTN